MTEVARKETACLHGGQKNVYTPFSTVRPSLERAYEGAGTLCSSPTTSGGAPSKEPNDVGDLHPPSFPLQRAHRRVLTPLTS